MLSTVPDLRALAVVELFRRELQANGRLFSAAAPGRGPVRITKLSDLLRCRKVDADRNWRGATMARRAHLWPICCAALTLALCYSSSLAPGCLLCLSWNKGNALRARLLARMVTLPCSPAMMVAPARRQKTAREDISVPTTPAMSRRGCRRTRPECQAAAAILPDTKSCRGMATTTRQTRLTRAPHVNGSSCASLDQPRCA